MTRLRPWLLAARPKTLPAGAAPVVMGTAMAIAAGGFHPWAALACLVGALLIQIGTNYANDYFDYIHGADTADRIGPTRATQAGWVTPSAMKWAAIAAFALVLVPGAFIVWRGGWPFVVIGMLSVLFGVLYTGGPRPLGYMGLGDPLVLVFFGPVAVGGTYYVQTLALSAEVIVAGLAPGLFSVAILTVNNLRDLDQDRRSGKKTLAVRFGRSFARREYLLSILVAAGAIPVYLAATVPGRAWVLLSLLTLPVAIPAVRTVFTKTDGHALNTMLATTGKLLLLFTALFSVGWLL
jgi:1,4-dihydroxy-2-naphthoate octaprenyltransferase